jgi:type III pantothenate kinase
VGKVSAVLVASVGPQPVLEAITTAAAAYWRCPVARIESSAHAHGISIAYAEPARFGVDRFLGLIAAHAIGIAAAGTGRPNTADAGGHPANVADTAALVVDAGTALTFDGLLANGTHLGGQILPGIGMLRSSLLQGTRLPSHESQDHADLWGQDTGPAIAAASLQAPAALAERLFRDLEQRTGRPPRLILSGGDAERLAPHLQLPAEHHPDLVLRGLARFASA